MKRTDLVNHLNGIWPALIGCYILKSDSTMQGVELWQFVLGCTAFGILAFIPQFGFNWLQTGHTWKNDKGEIKRALIAGVVSGFVLSFIPVGEWMWKASLVGLAIAIILWKWQAIKGLFKKT